MAEEARQYFPCSVTDIETEPFPFEAERFDLVICNQVFEHLKNVFHPLDEIYRVLRVGGMLIFSVPNLASAHNRVLLGLGRQPTSIRVIGPHVRGFTHRETVRFLTRGGLFKLADVTAVGFYPLPSRAGDWLARRLPDLAHNGPCCGEGRSD